MKKIDQLVEELRTLSKYGAVLGLLSWDEEVTMPPKSHAFRGEINALLSSELHKKFTDPQLSLSVDELYALGKQGKLSDSQWVIVRETKRDIDQAKKLPVEFVEKMALLTTRAFRAWAQAREKKEFKLFQPLLEEIVAMKKQEAELIGYKNSPYDALIDEFEPGMTSTKLDELFVPLKENLARIISAAKGPVPKLPPARYPIDLQQQLNELVVRSMGYDLEAGRIDASLHPFTMAVHNSDVRVTTRYDEEDLWVNIGSLIHETGHALYDQGLPEKYFGTPLGEPVSLAIHESQSRGWENFVGRSEGFIDYIYPEIKKLFPDIRYSAKDLYKWLNRIEPNFIRVESDEVTYNMHIVLRYEIERSLVEGNLDVKDVPAAWNEKVTKYLGLKVPSDDLGVLQDVHWAHGSIGYFPTYTLGNIYAAQLFSAVQKEHPRLNEEFAKGEFGTYLQWLRQNVHKEGRRYQPEELIEKATGSKPSAEFLLRHLEAKAKLQQT